MKKNPPKIAVIVLNWNGLEDTKECLDSVKNTAYESYKVFVIDNASSKNELQQIQKFCEHNLQVKDWEYIQSPSNLGFSGGNNLGIHKALEQDFEWIFLLNNDTIVDKNLFTSLAEQIHKTSKKQAFPKGLGILATSMINYYSPTRLDNIGHHVLSSGDTVPRGRNQSSGIIDTLKPTSLMGACAGAALYKSSMLQEIGLLDEDFFLNYEDSDISLRAIVNGWECSWSPGSKVFHKINASIGKIKNSAYRVRSQRNQLWAYLNNMPLAVILLNFPNILARELLVFLGSILTFRWQITGIFLQSRWQVVKSIPLIIKKRKQARKNATLSSWWIWTHQKNWIKNYWQYFVHIVIRRQKSVMESSSSSH